MRVLFKIIALLAVVFLPLQASASNHRGVYDDLGNTTGIYIAPLIHGQMQVLYDNHAEILALAKTHSDDPVMARILDFEWKQRMKAGFGLLSISVSDANQYLHRPTHGYLAGTRAALERMRETATYGSQEMRLYDRIEQTSIANYGSSMMLCEYSALGFNTNTPVGPDWSKLNTVTFLIPLASLLALMIVLALGLHHMVFARRQRPKPVF